MISLLREFTKSWIFTLLMGLLIASFAVFGLRDVFSQVGDSTVIAAGKRTVSVEEFKTVFDNYKQSVARQNNGQGINNEDFVAAGQHLAMLDEMADNLALTAWFDSQGIKPSPKLIVDQISQQPYFFNNATGKFDKDIYRQVLSGQHLTEQVFERDVSDQIATAQFGNAALAGLKAPRIYAIAEAAVSMQTRDFSLFVIGPENVATVPQPTDADVAAFYKTNLAALTIPEMRQAEVVIFSTAQFESGIEVSDEDLRKAYQFRLDSLKTPETRSFVQITAPDMGQAAAIAAALKAGDSPDVVAKAHKGTVISYDYKPQTAVPDAKLGAAAFALQSGEVSAPVKGDLGIAVVKMGDIRIGSTPSFESQRADLLAGIRKERAADKLNTVSHAFADAMAAGDDFRATAQKLGLKITPIAPMFADGRTENPQLDYSKFPALVKGVFALQPGAASDVEEMGNGEYFAIKLNVVKPAGAPPLDRIKPQLAEAWRAQKAANEVQEMAEKVSDRLDNGESFAKVAADLHAPIKPFTGVDRETGAQRVGPQIAGRVFVSNPGANFQIPVNQDHIVVGRVDAVHQADAQSTNVRAAGYRAGMSASVAKDIGGLTRIAARKSVKTTTYPTVAIRALGVTPPDPKADAKGAKDKDKS